jgi:hypothetical protein
MVIIFLWRYERFSHFIKIEIECMSRRFENFRGFRRGQGNFRKQFMSQDSVQTHSGDRAAYCGDDFPRVIKDRRGNASYSFKKFFKIQADTFFPRRFNFFVYQIYFI